MSVRPGWCCQGLCPLPMVVQLQPQDETLPVTSSWMLSRRGRGRDSTPSTGWRANPAPICVWLQPQDEPLSVMSSWRLSRAMPPSSCKHKTWTFRRKFTYSSPSSSTISICELSYTLGTFVFLCVYRRYARIGVSCVFIMCRCRTINMILSVLANLGCHYY